MFPGYGCPVNGFLTAAVTSEKFPCRISAVGTDEIDVDVSFCRTPSYAIMKNVRLRPS